MEFFKKMAKSGKPFFLHYGIRSCHFDNYPNEKHTGRGSGKLAPAKTFINGETLYLYRPAC